MTIGRTACVIAIVLLGGCTVASETACGPALPPIASATPQAVPPPAPKRPPHPLDNLAAMGGR